LHAEFNGRPAASTSSRDGLCRRQLPENSSLLGRAGMRRPPWAARRRAVAMMTDGHSILADR
jgi:hypothetical protein